jgi:SpoVK/Ycf46/Vps4 family AAA+-type ATPase
VDHRLHSPNQSMATSTSSAAWVDLAEVEGQVAEVEINNASGDSDNYLLLLSLPADGVARSHELTTTLVRPFRFWGSLNDTNDEQVEHSFAARCDGESIVRVHPYLYEFLCIAALETGYDTNSTVDNIAGNNFSHAQQIIITPLPMDSMLKDNFMDCAEPWYAAIVKEVVDLPNGSVLEIAVLFGTATGDLPEALQGRVIRSHTTMLLWLPGDGYVIAVVQDVVVPRGSNDDCSNTVFRVHRTESFAVKVVALPAPQKACVESFEDNLSSSATSNAGMPMIVKDCSGYETLLQHITDLLWLHRSNAAPSGILLTGCSGIGKTRLACCVAVKMQLPIHWISIHELLLLASWATEEQLIRALMPSGKKYGLLILDDLEVAGSDSNEEERYSNDQERRLVRNSLVQVIDRLVEVRIPMLGIGRDKGQIHSDLVKVSRFEKEVAMLPPTQRQRELMLFALMSDVSGATDSTSLEQFRLWSELIAIMTAGCVAADLRNVCIDAWNKGRARAWDDDDKPNGVYTVRLQWNDLALLAQNCIPSQLAALDVTKPVGYLDICDADDWARIHELAWSKFSGYATVKKRIYRTVVAPWRRMLRQTASDTSLDLAISPPFGVLFHGPSGCGKSQAAKFLGSSLGLPMIRVRAADILDKWLGGSEAVVRSLFARSRAAAPSILFFDEIDAIANTRTDDGESVDVMSRLLSTLLNEMDGVSSCQEGSRVLVVACTNRLESLDSALLRPGRLDDHILLGLPDFDDAVEIASQYFANIPFGNDVNICDIAIDLVDRSASCADIEGLCRQAVFCALRHLPKDASAVCVSKKDVMDAIKASNLNNSYMLQ